MNLNHKTIIHS